MKYPAELILEFYNSETAEKLKKLFEIFMRRKRPTDNEILEAFRFEFDDLNQVYLKQLELVVSMDGGKRISHGEGTSFVKPKSRPSLINRNNGVLVNERGDMFIPYCDIASSNPFR